MPIFSRRIIQRLLDENRAFLTDIQIAEHIKKLNANDDGSIATEWEILILNVLSKVGNVQHEITLSGTTKPDIFCHMTDGSAFVADITAISDESYEKENPINYFNECLFKYLKENELTAEGFSLEVGSEKIGEYGNRKIQLCLPPKKDIQSFIKKSFKPIAEARKKNPRQALITKISEGSISLTVTYNPHDKFFSSHYASYSALYSLDRNPIYNRLKKKADQLRRAGYQGIMGGFLCDAGCSSINSDFRSVDEISQDKIIEAVFRKNSSLSFIVVLSLEEQHHLFTGGTTKYIKHKFYANSSAKHRVNDVIVKKLFDIRNYFPVPETMPVNVRHRLKLKSNEGLSFYGGFSMSNNKIKISSRMITEMFAGKLAFDNFDKGHKAMNMDNINYIAQFFRNQLMEGKMIKNVCVEKCQDKDDDWIEFEYGEPDAAISIFK